jgi:hypothetical protein
MKIFQTVFSFFQFRLFYRQKNGKNSVTEKALGSTPNGYKTVQ